MCDPLSYDGAPGCQSVWVPGNFSDCSENMSFTCNASVHLASRPEPAGFSVGWGMVLSLACDVVISVGLALQKTGHHRVRRSKRKTNVLHQPVWVLGLTLMICGEIGNLGAYGDRHTPTSVITAVGCIGVVANLVIATVFLKEPFRFRDLAGGMMVVMGVIFITTCAPTNSTPLTGDSLNALLMGWEAIVIYIVYGGGILLLACSVKRIGHTSVIWYLLLSSLIGSFTVLSSKPVSTFALRSIQGLVNGSFNDKLMPEIATSALCDLTSGFGDGVDWRQVAPNKLGAPGLDGREYGCHFLGIGQLHYPAFWVFLVVLIVTAIAQVKYLNDALSIFSNSEVIPVHYVFFTMTSVVGATFVYQEKELPRNDRGCIQWWSLHFFLDGIMATFMGVYLITTQREHPEPTDKKEDHLGLGASFLGETTLTEGQLHAQVDLDSASPDPALGEKVDSIHIHLGTGGACAAGAAAGATPCSAAGSGAAASAASTPWTNASSNVFTPSPVTSRPGSLHDRPGSSLSSLTPSHSRKIIMGEKGDSQPVSAMRQSRMSRGLGPSPNARVSFVDTVAETAASALPMPKLSGLDARSPEDRQSRASNVISFLSALGGGHQAAFMFDPADRAANDTGALRRESERRARASEAARMSTSIVPPVLARLSVRTRGVTIADDGTRVPERPSPSLCRGRAVSSPAEPAGGVVPRACAVSASEI